MSTRLTLALIASLTLSAATLAQTPPELDKAQKQADANDLTAAASTLDAYLKLHPERAPGWARRGIVASQANDDHAALADFDLAQKNGMPAPMLSYRRAHAYAAMGNSESALAQLELAMTSGIPLGAKLDDKAFDPIRDTPRFKAVLAQNDKLLHPCTDEPHRAFDFWVGEWTVTTKNGPRVGDSSIKRILNDCVILESWAGAAGGNGQSFNNYDPLSNTWKQFWVDAAGSRQEYEDGVYKDGALRFTGHNPGPKGEPWQQRFIFYNVDPGPRPPVPGAVHGRRQNMDRRLRLLLRPQASLIWFMFLLPAQLRNQHLQLLQLPRIQIEKQKSGPLTRPHLPARGHRTKHSATHAEHHLHLRTRRKPQPRLRFDVTPRHADIQHAPAKELRAIGHQHLGPAIDGVAAVLPALRRLYLAVSPSLQTLVDRHSESSCRAYQRPDNIGRRQYIIGTKPLLMSTAIRSS